MKRRHAIPASPSWHVHTRLDTVLAGLWGIGSALELALLGWVIHDEIAAAPDVYAVTQPDTPPYELLDEAPPGA